MSAQTAVALGLLSEDDAQSKILIAISHDCDIATDNLRVEPTVEFVVGNLIDRVDGAYTRARNARILHLEFETPDGKRAVAFAIRDRREVDKEALSDHPPETGWSHASTKGLTSLRWWLAARYFRSSFADTFESRLRQSKLDERIDKLLSPHGEYIHGIFFMVDDGEGNNRIEDEPHELRALVVYDDEATEEQVAAVKTASDAISAAFKGKFFDNGLRTWKKIELVTCEGISDEIFSFAALRVFKQWRLEFRSLGDDPQQLPIRSI